MDRLTVLIATAHRRLLLRRLLIAIERNPSLLEKDIMAIPNFEGLVEAMDKLEFDLDSEASKLHNEIASVGTRGLDAIKKGGDKVAGIKARVARVEQFVNKLEGSNGGGPLSGSSNTSGEKKEEPKAAAKVAEVITSDDVGTVQEVLAEGEKAVVAAAEPAASWGAKPVA